jgi:phage tail protein X
MADLPFEYLRVEAEDLTPSQIVWRRYKRPAPQILGKFLDANPHIAPALGEGPFIPFGTVVRIPIDLRLLAGKPQLIQTTNLIGTV